MKCKNCGHQIAKNYIVGQSKSGKWQYYHTRAAISHLDNSCKTCGCKNAEPETN